MRWTIMGTTCSLAQSKNVSTNRYVRRAGVPAKKNFVIPKCFHSAFNICVNGIPE